MDITQDSDQPSTIDADQHLQSVANTGKKDWIKSIETERM